MADLLIPFRTRLGEWGYCNRARELVHEPLWEQALPFRGRDIAHVRKDQKSGVIDRAGRVVIEPSYDWIGNQDYGYLVEPQGVVLLQNGWSYGVMDLHGKVLVEVGHEDPDDALRAAGIEVEEPPPRDRPEPDLPDQEILDRYEVVHPFSEDRAVVYRDGFWGWIDREGREIVPLDRFASVHPFEDGIALASIPEPNPPTFASPTMQRMAANLFCFGFVDRDGKTIVDFKYRNARAFDGELAFVMSKSTQWGYIGRDGTEYFED